MVSDIFRGGDCLLTLIFYDFDFNPIFESRFITSVKWREFYNKTGTFEAHLKPFDEIISRLLAGSLTAVREKERTAVITGYEADGEELVLYGRSPGWLFEKRVVPPFERTGRSDTICRELAAAAFSDCGYFLLGSDFEGSEVTLSKENPATLYDTVKNLLSQDKLGHSVDFDVKNKKLVFNILKGENRDLILSEGFKNAYGIRISGDILDMANCGVYKSGDGILKTDTDALPLLRLEAICENADTPLGVKNSGAELSFLGIKPGVDCKLGDVVRIKPVFGDAKITVTKRISGFDILKSDGCEKVTPIFEEV